MGLEKFNKIPDNKGGRKPKSSNESSPGRDPQLGYETNPMTRDKDSEGYWQQVWDHADPDSPPTNEQTAIMARFAQVQPRTVKERLAYYGIYSYPDYTEPVFNFTDEQTEPDDDDEDDPFSVDHLIG